MPARPRPSTNRSRRWPRAAALTALIGAVALGSSLAYRASRRAPAAGRHSGAMSSSGGAAAAPSSPTTGPVVALSLAAEEIVLALGGPSRLAAVTPWARNPTFSSASDLAASVEATVAGSSIEQVITLRPERVYVATYTDPRAREILARCGIPTAELEEFRSFAAIRRTIERLGDDLGLGREARQLRERFDRRISTIRERAGRAVEGRAGARVPVLYVGTDLESPWTAGRDTIIDEVITSAGGVNVAAAHGVVHEVGLNTEAVLRWQPVVLLLDGEPHERDERIAELRDDPILSALDAVVEARVVVVPTRLLTSTSHHVARAVELVFEGLHPEVARTP